MPWQNPSLFNQKAGPETHSDLNPLIGAVVEKSRSKSPKTPWSSGSRRVGTLAAVRILRSNIDELSQHVLSGGFRLISDAADTRHKPSSPKFSEGSRTGPSPRIQALCPRGGCCGSNHDARTVARAAGTLAVYFTKHLGTSWLVLVPA